MDERYRDMLDLEVPEPPEGICRMSLSARAAQFSPFAALTGFEEEIEQAAATIENG